MFLNWVILLGFVMAEIWSYLILWDMESFWVLVASSLNPYAFIGHRSLVETIIWPKLLQSATFFESEMIVSFYVLVSKCCGVLLFCFYKWLPMQSNFDPCGNQKTFRPKKSAPSGSKVGIFICRLVNGFFCILFMVYVQPIEPSMHFGYKM